MHALRTSSTLIRLVLAWLVLTLGVAVASPMVAPKAMEMVCSAGGTSTLIVVDDDGAAVEAGQHTLLCSMCLPAAPPVALPATHADRPPPPPTYAPMPIEPVRIAALAGAPLPPRGPPSHT